MLPHRLVHAKLCSLEEVARAISEMWVRGAPLIGVTAAYGLALAMRADCTDEALTEAHRVLFSTRPTAVNLRWALDRLTKALQTACPSDRESIAYKMASKLAEEDVRCCEAIGTHGLTLFEQILQKKSHSGPLRILTHCNAGWLATVDWGTALAPIYKAQAAGMDVHVFVDETRPRNQGASLTAWELVQQEVPHSIIVDNAGGHLMQHGLVDLCIVGSDRTTASGDVCNKIGTYLKALAAADNGVPFYAALPFSTIDWTIRDGLREIPIEERTPREVTHVRGRAHDGRFEEVAITPSESTARNFGFDVTPARLVGKIITERGIADANEESLAQLYREGGESS